MAIPARRELAWRVHTVGYLCHQNCPLMKLFHAPGACSLSPHIVLLEVGLEIDLCKVDLKTSRLEVTGDFTI